MSSYFLPSIASNENAVFKPTVFLYTSQFVFLLLPPSFSFCLWLSTFWLWFTYVWSLCFYFTWNSLAVLMCYLIFLMLCVKFLPLFFQIFFLFFFLSYLLWSYHYTYVGMLNCVSKIYKESEDMSWIRRKYLQIVYLINPYMRIKSSCNLFGKQIISLNMGKIFE